MITRPLDLASRLRPQPRSFDWLFFVNGGLIVLFFVLFGSKFVLAPSVGIDFRLPEVAGAELDARPATHHINVTNSGLILVRDGMLTPERLQPWLSAQARSVKDPVLLVLVSQGVPTLMAFEIGSAARAAGFHVRFAAVEPNAGARGTIAQEPKP